MNVNEKSISSIYTKEQLTLKAKQLFLEERQVDRLDGWFIGKEIARASSEKLIAEHVELKAAKVLKNVIVDMPIHISEHAVFAGTQGDAFAKSYALINPTFEVSSFTGYCDPTAVFSDIEPNDEFTQERIEQLRAYTKESDYVKALDQVYKKVETYTSESVFFVEQVTGHLIPDFKYVLENGIVSMITELDHKLQDESDEIKIINYNAMKTSLEGAVILANRYADCAKEMQTNVDMERKVELQLMENTLRSVPENGATNLYEAIQAFIILWQVMCLEQAPNPFAFSVGNADRIFEPYRKMGDLDRETSSGLFKHFLVFFNVGDRSWAISQNIIVGGKSNEGDDLTNECSYALLDAYYDMNLPQPILSIKLHKNTPDTLYESMGRFFFTPGCLTPSFFNDDSMFEVLSKAKVDKEDLENYSIAGCQEPLIMGKDNANTTNSWLNLAKILELTLNDGVSMISSKKIGPSSEFADAKEALNNIREQFYKNVAYYVDLMVEAANDASKAVSLLPVPFLSSFMFGIETGYDMRDSIHQGTKYNGSGCLIHGLSVVADSFIAIDTLLNERPEDCEGLIEALKSNFENNEALRQYLKNCQKYGNNTDIVDQEAVEIVEKISDFISAKKNYLGNAFRPDWSSPSTHLLYGYWVGATPDGRMAREMLGYGIDPLYGEADSGMGSRMLSNMRLPFEKMNGGYASHLGIDPKYFKGTTVEEKGIEFKNKVIKPLFFNPLNTKTAPFYLYVNVTTPEILKKVMENPKKYAPSGVYIMRIHGTFVNFLDLSYEIQKDIIKRLDLKSTTL